MMRPQLRRRYGACPQSTRGSNVPPRGPAVCCAWRFAAAFVVFACASCNGAGGELDGGFVYGGSDTSTVSVGLNDCYDEGGPRIELDGEADERITIKILDNPNSADCGSGFSFALIEPLGERVIEVVNHRGELGTQFCTGDDAEVFVLEDGRTEQRLCLREND